MFQEMDSFFSFNLFVQAFNNYKNKIKNNFIREEILGVELFNYLKFRNKVNPVKKIVCNFDTKKFLIRRWNEMVDNIEIIESAHVITILCSMWLENIFEQNDNEIAAYEQFLSQIIHGNISHNLIMFEYSNETNQFVGFCFKNWQPLLMEYEFNMDKYFSLEFELV